MRMPLLCVVLKQNVPVPFQPYFPWIHSDRLQFGNTDLQSTESSHVDALTFLAHDWLSRSFSSLRRRTTICSFLQYAANLHSQDKNEVKGIHPYT